MLATKAINKLLDICRLMDECILVCLYKLPDTEPVTHTTYPYPINYNIYIIMTGFGKMCIVHTPNFDYLKIYKYHSEWYTALKFIEKIEEWYVVPPSLKVSYLSQ